MGRDRPKSMRIRSDEGNEHRLDAIQEAAELYDRNGSDAVALACDDMARLAGVLKKLLELDDLTRGQQRELAEALNRALSLEVDVRQEQRYSNIVQKKLLRHRCYVRW